MLLIFPLFLSCICPYVRQGFPGRSDGKESIGKAGDPGVISGWGRSLGEGDGYPLSLLAWRIPWTEEPGRLQALRSQKVRHNWATKHTHTNIRQYNGPFSLCFLFKVSFPFAFCLGNLYFFFILSFSSLLILPSNVSIQLISQWTDFFFLSYQNFILNIS